MIVLYDIQDPLYILRRCSFIITNKVMMSEPTDDSRRMCRVASAVIKRHSAVSFISMRWREIVDARTISFLF